MGRGRLGRRASLRHPGREFRRGPGEPPRAVSRQPPGRRCGGACGIPLCTRWLGESLALAEFAGGPESWRRCARFGDRLVGRRVRWISIRPGVAKVLLGSGWRNADYADFNADYAEGSGWEVRAFVWRGFR